VRHGKEIGAKGGMSPTPTLPYTVLYICERFGNFVRELLANIASGITLDLYVNLHWSVVGGKRLREKPGGYFGYVCKIKFRTNLMRAKQILRYEKLINISLMKTLNLINPNCTTNYVNAHYNRLKMKRFSYNGIFICTKRHVFLILNYSFSAVLPGPEFVFRPVHKKKFCQSHKKQCGVSQRVNSK
jgi:hypothetical protein